MKSIVRSVYQDLIDVMFVLAVVGNFLFFFTALLALVGTVFHFLF